MRDQQPDRNRARNLGAVDPRISSSTRKLSYVPDIPTVIGTPVLWMDPESISMTVGTEQPTFNERMGISIVKSTFTNSRSFWQMPNGMNGRNCWRSDGPDDADFATNAGGASGMRTSAAIVLGPNLTAFFVIRMNSFKPGNFDGTAAIYARHQTSESDGANNFFWNYSSTQKFSFDRVDTGQVDTAASSNPAVVHIVTTQSTQARNETWLDGTVGTNADPANTALVDTRILFLGVGLPNSPLTYYTRCDFGDIIMYNSILSAANRNGVEKYLGRKYGVTVA